MAAILSSSQPVFSGQTLILHVDALASDGRGIARHEGLAIFMENALPGQCVQARVLALRKRLADAVVEKVLKPAPDEYPAPCPHAGDCGGCPWQTLPYERQLFWKQRIVEDALSRIGHIASPPVLPILPSPQIWYYRNKMAFAFGTDSGGALTLGQRARRSHTVVDLHNCRMQSSHTMQLLETVRQFARSSGYPPYNGIRRKGFWRALVVRRTQSGQWTVEILVAPHPEGKQAAVRIGQALSDIIMKTFKDVTGVILSLRSSSTDIAQGEATLFQTGKTVLHETLQRPAEVFGMATSLELGFDHRTFFQVNTLAAERLYSETARQLVTVPAGRLLDLYCGVGSIGLFLAPLTSELLGVEERAPAITLARENACRAGLSHFHFEAGDAAKAFTLLRPASEATETVVVVDPPRAGLSAQVCEGLLRLRPRRLAYISCNPATLARDAQRLSAKYTLQIARPVDLFPQTQHVECASLFMLKGAD